MTLALWLITVVAAANLVTMIVLWREVFKPLAASVDRLYPAVDKLAKSFPDVLRALRERGETEHATELSLRDAVTMLEDAVVDYRHAAGRDNTAREQLKIDLHDDRLLATQDREQLQRLAILLDRLGVRVEAGVSSTKRIEHTTKGVASDLALAQSAVEGVAANLKVAQTAVDGVASDLVASQEAVAGVAGDLAAAHRRADQAEGPAGTAADAAMSTKRAAEIAAREVRAAGEAGEAGEAVEDAPTWGTGNTTPPGERDSG